MQLSILRVGKRIFRENENNARMRHPGMSVDHGLVLFTAKQGKIAKGKAGGRLNLEGVKALRDFLCRAAPPAFRYGLKHDRRRTLPIRRQRPRAARRCQPFREGALVCPRREVGRRTRPLPENPRHRRIMDPRLAPPRGGRSRQRRLLVFPRRKSHAAEQHNLGAGMARHRHRTRRLNLQPIYGKQTQSRQRNFPYFSLN